MDTSSLTLVAKDNLGLVSQPKKARFKCRLATSQIGCGVKPVLGSHFGVGEFTTHFRTYFSGDWDVHWGFDPWPCALGGNRWVPTFLHVSHLLKTRGLMKVSKGRSQP